MSLISSSYYTPDDRVARNLCIYIDYENNFFFKTEDLQYIVAYIEINPTYLQLWEDLNTTGICTGWERGVTFITESGIMCLLADMVHATMTSDTKEFYMWFTTEILPIMEAKKKGEKTRSECISELLQEEFFV